MGIHTPCSIPQVESLQCRPLNFLPSLRGSELSQVDPSSPKTHGGVVMRLGTGHAHLDVCVDVLQLRNDLDLV